MVEHIVNNQGGSHIDAVIAWNPQIGTSHGNLRPFVHSLRGLGDRRHNEQEWYPIK